MRRNIYYIFLIALLFLNGSVQATNSINESCYTGSSGTELGDIYEPIIIRETYDTRYGVDNFGNENKDFCLSFIICRPTLIISHFNGSELSEIDAHLWYLPLDESTDEPVDVGDPITIDNFEEKLEEKIELFQYLNLRLEENIVHGVTGTLFVQILQPGYYIFHSEGSSLYGNNYNGKIRSNIYLNPLGTSMNALMDIGYFSEDFNYNFSGIFDWFDSQELYFNIRLNSPMNLNISSENSADAFELIEIMDQSGKILATSDASLSIKDARLEVGEYVIHSIIKEKGEVTLNISGTTSILEGDKKENPIDIEYSSLPLDFKTTFNTAIYSDFYHGNYQSDVFHRLKTNSPVDILISIPSSKIKGGVNVYLIDEKNSVKGTLNTSNTKELYLSNLPVGIYYIIIEGRTENGEVSLRVQGEKYFEYALSGNKNYISTIIPTVATSSEKMVFSNPFSANRTINYYDFLGRPEQTVQYGNSPLLQDIVTHTEYDGLGRESCKWLPVVHSLSAAYIPLSAMKDSALVLYSDSSAYSKTLYEDSPLNRIFEQYGPGQIWHDAKRSIRNDYLINSTDDECRYFYVGGTRKAPQLLLQGVYPGGELSVTETMDEDNHLSFQFTDKRDLVVINRQLAENDTLDTYYVYDDFGNLCFVLPPMAADSLKKNMQETLDLYAFQYRYDDRNRCIGKKFPGCEWMEMIYDAADRLIFTQNGEQRKRGEWSITLSDCLGRSVIVGSYNGQPDRTALEQKTVYAIFNPNSATAYYGYEIQGLSIDNNLKSLQINYYDTYDYKRCLVDFPVSLQYEKDASYGIRYGDDSDLSICKGLLTGSVTSMLGSEQKLFSATYYDFYQRPVQVRSTAANDTTIVSKSLFNFVGQVTDSQQEYGVSTTLNTHQVYDHAGRMTSETHRLNNDERSTSLFEYAYDELGRLSNVKKSNGKEYSFLTKNQYNIRSWLTQIASPQFKQTLHYTDGAGTPTYNGNISSMMWETDNLAGGYKFTYDGFSRLKDAIYGEGESLSTGTDHSTRCFSEQVGSYDKHGNILHLKRFGQTANNTYELIDDLTLNYNGNQLTFVNDSCYNSAYGNSFEFKDGIKQSVEYLYDANGNLIQDLNKKITNIEYNCLNLPSQIQFENGNSISYLYDALGNKHRVTYVIDGMTTTTDYCGNAIYENGVLTKLLTNQGYITLADTTYHYFVQDHQGNNRVVVDQNGNVEEVNHYYPFGGIFASTSDTQPYKYNGKKLDSTCGLDWYDYGARMYDATLGRWNVVDPMNEMKFSIGTYVYCLNNPVNLVDPNGCLESTHTDSLGNVISVFDDGDLGVYRHNTDKKGTEKKLKEMYSEENTTAGGEYMGETEYWDEFGSKEDIKNGARILFGTSWDYNIALLNQEANRLGLARTAYLSLPGKKYDIKASFTHAPAGGYTGRMLNGKYASARSAGNFLAGMNGATGTFMGKYISLELYMRLAGAVHSAQNHTNLFKAPYYGEVPEAGRRIVAGFNYGVYKALSKNWIAK